MDFADAFRIMRSGGVVTRQSLLETGLTAGIMAPPADSGIMPFFAVRTSDGRVMPWTPQNMELFAEDWIVVQGEGVAGHG